MRQLILTLLFLLSATICFADGGFSFFAGDYYYYIDYGLVVNKESKEWSHEYSHGSYLNETKIIHSKYDSILRVNKDDKNVSFEQYTQTAKLTYSDSKNHIVASVGEYIFVLTPDFEIFQAYRNTYFKNWINDKEILVNSEDGSGGSKYGTSDYIINVIENTARKADQ